MQKPIHSYTLFLPKVGEVRIKGDIKGGTEFYTNRYNYDKLIGVVVDTKDEIIIRYDVERSAEERPDTFGYIWIATYNIPALGETYGFYGMRALH